MSSVKDFLSEDQKKSVEEAIRNAELNTSGEIRIHLESHCKIDVLDRATQIFAKLEMHKTKLRNGVLFYVAVKDHKLAVLGDEGINNVVPVHFWDDIKDKLIARFKAHQHAEGFCEAIASAGQQLKSHFPLAENDSNELSNEITYDH